MTILNILHISDAHFGDPHDSDEEHERITSALVKAIKVHVEGKHSRPDLCIFSGDLAYNGFAEEFKRGETWLKNVLEASGDDCLLFVVPGNHDVKRPEKGEHADLIRGFRAATHDANSFADHRKDIETGVLLKEFREWHKNARVSNDRLVSDWETAVSGCFHQCSLRSVPINLIGLNTALISYHDDEKEELLSDIAYLNRCLAQCNSEEQLGIVVSHHPIGVRTLNHGSWLTPWNDEKLSGFLLQNTGPHIYLYGHVHHAEGQGIMMMTGQSLSFFGAGATYQNSKYPMRFAFYEIDLLKAIIRPTVFVYYKEGGRWIRDESLSQEVRAFLPNSKEVGENEKYAKLIDSFNALVSEYHRIHRIIGEIALQIGIKDWDEQFDKDSLRKKEQDSANISTLIPSPPDSSQQLSLVEQLIKEGQSGAALEYLQRLRDDNPKIWENNLQFMRIRLSALASSADPNHWNEAMLILSEYGQPVHFNWLAYGQWSIGELGKAIELAEKGYNLLLSESSLRDEWLLTTKIQNNLAYFYADAHRIDKADDARKLIALAISTAQEHKNNEQYIRYLDTQGFVRITFALSVEDVLADIRDCSNACAQGNEESLNKKHSELAGLRLSELLART